jgi:hypothetical protein
MRTPISNSPMISAMTSQDWAAADDLAGLLGVSSEELVREFAEEFEALTPGEQAEFMEAVDKGNAVLSDLHAKLDRIEERISHCHRAIRHVSASIADTSQRVGGIEAKLGVVAAR